MSTGTVLGSPGPGPGPVQVNLVTQNVAGQTRTFVVPPQISIGTGATLVPSVQLINNTGARARLWFPNADQLFVPPAGGFANPIDIPAGGSLTLQVKSAPNLGNYHYHVYCEASRDCAQGNSEPRVGCP